MVHTVHTAEENIKYIDISISIPQWHGCEKTVKYLQTEQRQQLNFGIRDATTINSIWAWPNLAPSDVVMALFCFNWTQWCGRGGGRGDACDVWQSRWPWSGSRDTALHVTAGAAAAAVYIVHCWRAAHGDNIVGCFVQRLADFLEYRYI